MYNLYALARNAGKYVDRDKRINKVQYIEYDFLAPDSVNEIFTALELLKKFTALSQNSNSPAEDLIEAGKAILEDDSNTIKSITINNSGFENNSRPVCISKVGEAYRIYKELVLYYAMSNLLSFINLNNIQSLDELNKALPRKPLRSQWSNVGGQLLPVSSVEALLEKISNGTIQNWEQVHDYYEENGKLYDEQKLQHAYASLLELFEIDRLDAASLKNFLLRSGRTKERMVNNIYESRAKDYQNEFRKMVYGSDAEMEVVTGRLEDNVFINQQKQELEDYKASIERVITRFKL
jgi:hypothetical protein